MLLLFDSSYSIVLPAGIFQWNEYGPALGCSLQCLPDGVQSWLFTYASYHLLQGLYFFLNKGME